MGGIAEAMGTAIGFLLPSLFVDPEDENNPELAREHIWKLCFVSAIIFCSAQLVALFMFKEKPFVPPTYRNILYSVL